MKNNFYEQLLALRIENNMSRAELAEKLSVSVRLISYWENGQRE
jgi:transcriptional regulator with XRE-family HTH domain